MEKCIIVHYHEIGLKGKNRRFFEDKLKESLKEALFGLKYDFVERIFGRIIIKLLEESDFKRMKEKIKNVFGVANFSLGYSVEPDIEKIQVAAGELMKQRKLRSFKVETKRAWKEFPLTSPEISSKVGGYLRAKTKVKVDVKNPDVICFIEIANPKRAFVYLGKIKGLGGLPVSTGGRVVALLSGGIDSPVACFLTLKRGVGVVFVHFHSYPQTPKASQEKAALLAKLLTQYQFRSKLYLVPFLNIQKEIITKCPAKFRVILYRRFMFRIAEEITKKERAKALVTGESIGQVASQTIENIGVIEEAIGLSVFRPLIGMDKEEIIDLAKKIKSFEISILPHQDCCSLFIPKHPATKASLAKVKGAENKLNNIEKLTNEALRGAEIKTFSYGK